MGWVLSCETGFSELPIDFADEKATSSRRPASLPRPLVLPQKLKQLSLTTLREKLIKIGAKVVRHGRYVTFQRAEVAISKALSAQILRLIDRPRPAPLPP
jgi:hypothetical protein